MALPDKGQPRKPSDILREQARQRGLLYFKDVLGDVKTRLTSLPVHDRAVFALACAEKLLSQHEWLPEEDRRPFSLSWRPVLDAMWDGLILSRPDAKEIALKALEAYRSSPYNHRDGQDGPDDADENAAAASIYASECFVTGDPQEAYWSAARAVDAAFSSAEEAIAPDPGTPMRVELSHLAQQNMHSIVQAELRRQMRALEQLEAKKGALNIFAGLRRESKSQ